MPEEKQIVDYIIQLLPYLSSFIFALAWYIWNNKVTQDTKNQVDDEKARDHLLTEIKEYVNLKEDTTCTRLDTHHNQLKDLYDKTAKNTDDIASTKGKIDTVEKLCEIRYNLTKGGTQ